MGRATPAVSVYMPVYNGMPFLPDAIDGVLAQTLEALELILVENGSTDGSGAVVRAAAQRDPRVRVLSFARPLGIVGAANAGIRAARAVLVARHDQDDLSDRRRLERQVAALERDPLAVAVGAICDGIDAHGRRIRPADRWRLLRRSPLPPFPHGSVCIRREAFERAGGYREGTHTWEDIDLFLRLSRLGRVLVVPEALYHYRYHGGSLTASSWRVGPGQALMWRCIDAHRRGEDWAPLLTAPPQAPGPDASADMARVARHAAGMLLWSGVPLPSDAPTPSGLAARLRWGWQKRSPATLRGGLRAVLRIRDAAAAMTLRGKDVVSWQPS